MALELPFSFRYQTVPSVRVALRSPLTGRVTHAEAIIDTGAEITLLDSTIAAELGIDLIGGPTVHVIGVGGEPREIHTAPVEISIPSEPALTGSVMAAFAPGIATSCGNLLGLDVLRHFDFGLQHSLRTGYLGITAAAAGV